MRNLIRMDLYRIRKSKAFIVCLILTAVFALLSTPLTKLLYNIARTFASEAAQVEPFPESIALSKFLSDPFPTLGALLALVSVSAFFYADIEFGYIKNIAGQMPKRGYTILSKFCAAAVHNLLFMLAGIVCNVLGTVLFQKIIPDADILLGVGAFVLKFLLMQSICAVLLLCGAGAQMKSLSTVLAVLMGSGLMSLIYSAIDAGIHQVPALKDISIAKVMPDQLLGQDYPPVVRSLLVSAVVIAVFLPLAIRVFDRRDVK